MDGTVSIGMGWLAAKAVGNKEGGRMIGAIIALGMVVISALVIVVLALEEESDAVGNERTVNSKGISDADPDCESQD